MPTLVEPGRDADASKEDCVIASVKTSIIMFISHASPACCIDETVKPTSPTSIDLTTATSGCRPAAALVQGPGVIAGKRVASIASIGRKE